ncbi:MULTISPECIES: ABC transporter permease [unclassified Rhizobium]|uniref:ABC transporter permease n=1 Tax=unclassified Rhizobium TaxID=2613769 RepID=UPI001ADCCBCF|nr:MULTISPECIES: FtsX-like permease family protein [unclassified Rhizobium]MBO9098390.1 FtsX-like permease family protein [Rhizobium sp. L58/93]MBO9132806.1 FtsX-like permease family protein [Rhizobium sp. B209b/85]MBO9168656.1 FtsX-like permease family protein [Rhizobium sp. L245/93]MBO9184606.1 FtsX-like permease family protein [Rhizobium sp. E27B/91]QXZ84787.1 FtsX-like permease family protein [Rhizobium sp. K1/93]
MLAVSLSALLSHWRRRPMQLAMLLLGLSLATALWSGVQAINAEARASYDRAAAMLGQDRLQQIVSADGELMPQSDFVALRRAGWLVSPVIEGDIRFGTVRIHVIGLDPVSLPAEAQQVNVSAGNDLLSFITPPGRMYVAPATATQLAGQPAPPLETASGLPPGTALVDIGIAQSLLDKHGQISRLILDPHQPAGLAPLSSIAPGLVVHAPDPQGDLVRLTDSFHLNLTAFGLLAFAVGLFIVYSAIGLAFEQRRQTFRTLRSLGLSARALIALLLAELLILALVAGLGGVVLGYFVASALLPDVAATLQGLYGAAVPGTLTLRPEWWATGMAIAVLGTLVSSAQSLWQVWRLPLLAPAQPRAWARASEAALKVQSGLALGFFAVGLTLALWGSGLVAGFAVLAGLLLGSALLLPVVMTLMLAIMQRLARGPLTQWFWADTRQQLPGLSLALMALLLALSANVGVGTMVASFRLTFIGWLDQRLAAELYVTARNEGEASALRTWLAPRVDAVLPIWNVEGTVAGRPAQVFGVANDRIYRDNWPMLQAVPDVWDRIAAGNTALINEQMSRREKLRVGDPLVLPGNWKTTIVGVYSDYGNPIGQAIVGIDGLTTHYPNVSRLRYGLRLDPAKTPALVDALEAQFHLPSQNVVDQASIKAKSLEIFEKTFAVTGALNVLTLGVAGLAMFASLMTLSGMRLSQIAPVWAMGLTRRHLVALEVARTMVLAVLTLVAALPVGIGLAWVLLAIVNVEAFGWRLPMHLFPSDWLRLAGFALVAALLAALIPLRRLATLSPSDLLKVFANER